jgi:hypothetical protein
MRQVNKEEACALAAQQRRKASAEFRMAAVLGEVHVPKSRSMKEGMVEQLVRGVQERLCNAEVAMNTD